jgi:hypothetical protein
MITKTLTGIEAQEWGAAFKKAGFTASRVTNANCLYREVYDTVDGATAMIVQRKPRGNGEEIFELWLSTAAQKALTWTGF